MPRGLVFVFSQLLIFSITVFCLSLRFYTSKTVLALGSLLRITPRNEPKERLLRRQSAQFNQKYVFFILFKFAAWQSLFEFLRFSSRLCFVLGLQVANIITLDI